MAKVTITIEDKEGPDNLDILVEWAPEVTLKSAMKTPAQRCAISVLNFISGDAESCEVVSVEGNKVSS